VPAAKVAEAEVTLVARAATLDPEQLARVGRRLTETLDPAGADDDRAAAEARAYERRGVWFGRNFRRAGGRLIADLDAEAFAQARTVIDALSAPAPAADGTRTRGPRRNAAPTPSPRSSPGSPPAGSSPSPAASAPRWSSPSPSTPSAAGRRGGDAARVRAGAATLDDGTAISAETARRIACDAALIPAVLGTNSEPLDLGRTARLATPAQRRALALHRDGCAFPGCTRPTPWTSVHHIRTGQTADPPTWTTSSCSATTTTASSTTTAGTSNAPRRRTRLHPPIPHRPPPTTTTTTTPTRVENSERLHRRIHRWIHCRLSMGTFTRGIGVCGGLPSSDDLAAFERR
jgi:hypothetical protein